MFLIGNFAMTGGNVESKCSGYGMYTASGTVTLKGGTLTMADKDYSIVAYSNSIIDFAGTTVNAKSEKNAALVIYDETSSYKITGGSVVLQSTLAGANALYTSLADGYAVWAGNSEAEADVVTNVTASSLIKKYVRIDKVKSYTLTLENVTEGTSASINGGTSIQYTAKPAESGKHFDHWELSVNGTTTNVGTEKTYTGKMPFSNATLKAVYATCTGGTATCEHQAVCDSCKEPYGSLAAHTYTAETIDAKYLKKEGDCVNRAEYYKSCSVCGKSSKGTDEEAIFYGAEATHSYGEWTSNGNGTHTRVCSKNNEHTETENCTGGTADCVNKAVCDKCHTAYGETAGHNYTAEVVDTKYLKSAADCEHKAVYYKSCTGCGKSSAGTTEAVTFTYGPAPTHTYGPWIPNGDGTHTRICSSDSSHKETKNCEGGVASCENRAVCTTCHTEYGNLAEHTYTAEVAEAKYLKAEAACEQKAVYYKSCTGCGNTSKGTAGEATFEYGEKPSHAYGAWTSNGDGTHSRVCAKDAAHKETEDCYGGVEDSEHMAVCEGCGKKYEVPVDLQALLNQGGTVKLTRDITISSTLQISKDVTLDLNGHVLKKKGTGRVINVTGGTFTLKDSNPITTHRDTGLPAGGVITGGDVSSNGSHDWSGGGIRVYSGTFNMTGGTIYNCKAVYGGGVDVRSNFYMSGNAAIRNCTSTAIGGGVSVSVGSFYMSDNATIQNCSSDRGGGVHVGGDGTFYMNGGTITDSPAVYGAADIHLERATMYANGGVVGNVLTWREITRSDDATDYTTFNGKVMLERSGAINDKAKLTVSFHSNGGSSVEAKKVLKGQKVDAPDEPTRQYDKYGDNWRHYWKFDGWYKESTCTNVWDFTNETVSNHITLYAKWTHLTHTGGTATCSEKAICEFCDIEYGGYDANNHDLQHVDKEEATIEETGNIEHWHCKDCEKDFTDEEGKNEIEEENTVIDKLSFEVKIGTEKWNALSGAVSFHTFFKDAQEVVITIVDNDDTTATIAYLLSDKELTAEELDSKNFTAYDGAFRIEPNNEYIIYAKLTDRSNNYCYINSNGIVLDNIAPVITGIANGKTYCQAQTVTVSDKYDVTVTVNGTPVTLYANGQFTLSPASGTQTVVATDKAGNVSAEMIVTVNDGHKGGTATCKDLAVCEYCGLEYGEKNPENHVGGTKIRKGYGASCTEDGYTGNTYCRSCGEELAEGEDIASFGHTYEKLVTDTATVTYRCKVCGDSYTEHSAAPQTGDASPVERTMAAAMLSGLALALMLVWNRKRFVK